MSCPLCGSQVARYFHYERATTEESGQFQFRLYSSTIILDYHVYQSGVSKPSDKNYESIILGRVDVDNLQDLCEFFQRFPLYLDNYKASSIIYDAEANTGTYKSRWSGGIILKYIQTQPFNRITFQDIEGVELFSLPESVFRNDCINAMSDFITAIERIRHYKPQ